MNFVQGPSALVDTSFRKLIDASDVIVPTYNVSGTTIPVPPFVDETAMLVFSYNPLFEAVTLTVIVQVAAAGMVPLLKLTLFPPASAVNVPPQLLVALRGVVLVRPSGYAFERATPVRVSLVFGFVIANVSVDVLVAEI